MTMQQFADHTIAVANECVGGLTNLQLQKVLYFAIGAYIRENGIDDLIEEIYTEPFEAWPYGPVVRSEYFRHNKYGRFKIERNPQRIGRYEVFNDYIIANARRSVYDLVEESHRHSTWRDNREAILQNELVKYELEDIANDFNEPI